MMRKNEGKNGKFKKAERENIKGALGEENSIAGAGHSFEAKIQIPA